MTHTPDDTTRRLDALAEELAQLRNRQEIDHASIQELVRLGGQLMTTAIAQQEAIRAFAEAADEDRATFREEIRRIWEYLLSQTGNGNRGNQ